MQMIYVLSCANGLFVQLRKLCKWTNRKTKFGHGEARCHLPIFFPVSHWAVSKHTTCAFMVWEAHALDTLTVVSFDQK